MSDRLLNFYQRLLLSRPWLSLGVILLLVALFALRIPDIRMEASADTLVIEGDKALKVLSRHRQALWFAKLPGDHLPSAA